jgi:hypothetical protein
MIATPVLILTAIISLVIGCLESWYATRRSVHYERDGRDESEREDGGREDGSGREFFDQRSNENGSDLFRVTEWGQGGGARTGVRAGLPTRPQ